MVFCIENAVNPLSFQELPHKHFISLLLKQISAPVHAQKCTLPLELYKHIILSPTTHPSFNSSHEKKKYLINPICIHFCSLLQSRDLQESNNKLKLALQDAREQAELLEFRTLELEEDDENKAKPSPKIMETELQVTDEKSFLLWL